MIFSCPEAIRPPTAKMNRIMMVGRICGSVTCHILRSLPAPSISAASYSPGSMELIADRYMMESQPIFCQMPEKVYMGRNMLEYPRRDACSVPVIMFTSCVRIPPDWVKI